MSYRTFGQTAFNPFAIGFGAMRLPILNGDPRQIDEKKSVEMIRYAIDHGVNYVDTAYPYHGGNSEIVVGKALRDGYRDKVRIADKMPVWLVKETADFDRYFDEQRTKLGVEKIDCYLFHALNAETWKRIEALGALEWAEKRRAAGHIEWLGFSFHGPYPEFVQIVDSHPSWDFCMIQYNYADEDAQAGRRGLEYAHRRGMGVIAMEPLRGGDLVRGIPESAAEPFRTLNPGRSLAEWGLRWLWNQPELSFMISGMSTLEQVKENVRLAGEISPPYLNEAETNAVNAVKQNILGLRPIRCTFCGYCRECPQGIPIPFAFDTYNDYQVYQNKERTRFMFNEVKPENHPRTCVSCRHCVEMCPQGIDIPQWLVTVVNLMDELEKSPAL